MNNKLPTVSLSDLSSVTGGDSSQAYLMRKAIRGTYGAIQMVGRTKFRAPPFNEGISTAAGEFTQKGTGIPLLRSFTATVDTVRKQVYGLATKIVAE